MPTTAPTSTPREPARRRLAAALVLLATLAGVLGVVVGTVAAPAPAGATGPHPEWAPGVRVPSSGRGEPWPSSTGPVQRGHHLTDVHVVLKEVHHSCVKDLDVMLDHGSRRTLLLSDVGEQGVTPFSCHDIHVPTLTIDDDCPAFPNPIPEAARKRPGIDICARPTDNDATGHNEDCFDTFGCFAANADLLWNTFHDRSPSSRWDLYVMDDAGDDAGSIGSWEVIISTTDQPPTSGTTTVDVHKGQDATITFPGSDPEDGTVQCELRGGPLKGTISDPWSGGCTKTYRAGVGATGQDPIGYVTKDTASHESPHGTVTLNIVNRPPVARTVNTTVRAGERVALDLGGTDPDPSEPVSCTSVANPRLGRLEGSGCARTYVAGSTPGVDQLTYTVSDGFGGTATGTVSVAVSSTTPMANPQEVTVTKGTPLAIALGGTDPQGRPLTCEVVASDIGTFGDLTGTGCTRTFVSKPGTSGRVTFSYVVRNDTGQTSPPALVGIRVANRAPVATSITRTVRVGETVTLPLGGTDPDPGETASCQAVGPALLGTLERVAGDGTGCSHTYTAGQIVGNDSFTYDVTDVLGARAKGSVTIQIVDPRPRADAKAVTAQKGTPVTIALTGSGGEGALTCQAPTATVQGKGTLAGTGCTRTFTAGARTSGADTFTYTVKDAKGRTSPAATVTITIANRAPSAPTVAVTVPPGDSTAVALGGTDPDPGEGVALTCTPATGATPRGRVSGSGCFVTYTAGATAGTDSFAYTVQDAAGATATGRVDVTIEGTAPAGCTAGEPQDARYVCRTYTDLLGRTASAADKAYWLGRLRGGENRAAIIRAFTGTPEYRVSVVRGIWQAYLGARPDAATEQRWVAQLGRGANPDLVRQEALASAAFYARAGGTPEGFVEGLHQQLLRRPATATEVGTLAAQLRSGTTRTALVGRLLAGTGADTPTVAAIYERFLRRSPGGETAYWVDRLQRGESELALVRLIVASAEYHDRA